jgi:hypothetical protein
MLRPVQSPWTTKFSVSKPNQFIPFSVTVFVPLRTLPSETFQPTTGTGSGIGVKSGVGVGAGVGIGSGIGIGLGGAGLGLGAGDGDGDGMLGVGFGMSVDFLSSLEHPKINAADNRNDSFLDMKIPIQK